MATQDTRNRLSAFSAKATGLGLKIGVPIATVAAVYLLYVVFGDATRHVGTMSPADRQYLVVSVRNTGLVLEWASVAICALADRPVFPHGDHRDPDDPGRGADLLRRGGALRKVGWFHAGGCPGGRRSSRRGIMPGGDDILAPGIWLALRDGITPDLARAIGHPSS